MAKIKELNINLADIEEFWARGSGRGGQKVNKTSNCVQLHHLPSGIRVSCHRERERSKNRFIALRSLVEKIEMLVSPQTSDKIKKLARIKKQKLLK